MKGVESVATPAHVEIDTTSGRIVVVGRSKDEVVVGLALLDAARSVRATEAEALTARLVTVMSAAGESVLPEDLVRFAQRRATQRARLLAEGYHTHASLAAVRGTTKSGARTFVSRAAATNRLFTVKHEGQTVIPAILVGDDGGLSPVASAVRMLGPAGLTGWELWAWLCSPSSWLSGRVPAEVFGEDPDRAMTAVRAYAEELTAHAS